MTDDLLTKLATADPHKVRAWVVKIIDVTPTQGYCTIDPNDGDVVAEVPYWGSAPVVGSIQTALMFDGVLGVISTGVAVSNVCGQGALANLGSNSMIGNEIYIDSVGNLRSYPQFITAAAWDASPRNQSDPPSSYPLGQSIMTMLTGQSAAGGWPYGASSVVVTTRRQEGDGNVQWWYRNTSTANQTEARYRSAGLAAGPWTPWLPAVGPDSGWIPITILPGFAANSANEAPSVRLKGGIVYVRGGYSNTGVIAINTNYTVGNIPAGYRPLINVVSRAGTNSGLASAGLWFAASGDVLIRTGPNLSAYYLFGGQSWPID
jgi:hypothetical protein